MKSKNKFQETLLYAKDTTNNIFVEGEIRLIMEELNDGKSIYEAFYNRDIFDEITLRMLLVGENSNKLEEILLDLKEMNKKQLNKYLENFTSFLTPFFVFIISSIILWLVLAIMSLIWEMGSFIK
jgi:type II secretory pathway component PulF